MCEEEEEDIVVDRPGVADNSMADNNVGTESEGGSEEGLATGSDPASSGRDPSDSAAVLMGPRSLGAVDATAVLRRDRANQATRHNVALPHAGVPAPLQVAPQRAPALPAAYDFINSPDGQRFADLLKSSHPHVDHQELLRLARLGVEGGMPAAPPLPPPPPPAPTLAAAGRDAIDWDPSQDPDYQTPPEGLAVEGFAGPAPHLGAGVLNPGTAAAAGAAAARARALGANRLISSITADKGVTFRRRQESGPGLSRTPPSTVPPGRFAPRQTTVQERDTPAGTQLTPTSGALHRASLGGVAGARLPGRPSFPLAMARLVYSADMTADEARAANMWDPPCTLEDLLRIKEIRSLIARGEDGIGGFQVGGKVGKKRLKVKIYVDKAVHKELREQLAEAGLVDLNDARDQGKVASFSVQEASYIQVPIPAFCVPTAREALVIVMVILVGLALCLERYEVGKPCDADRVLKALMGSGVLNPTVLGRILFDLNLFGREQQQAILRVACGTMWPTLQGCCAEDYKKRDTATFITMYTAKLADAGAKYQWAAHLATLALPPDRGGRPPPGRLTRNFRLLEDIAKERGIVDDPPGGAVGVAGGGGAVGGASSAEVDLPDCL